MTKPRTGSFLVPIICSRCSTAKRAEDGRTLYVDWLWAKNKRMICPPCLDTEKTMDALDGLTSWDEADDGVFGL